MFSGIRAGADLRDFMLPVGKSKGRTSRQVVDQLAGAIQRRDLGHAGTLDPFATGLLLLLAGKATKLVPYIHQWDKEYEAAVCLGVSTDTLDATGVVTATERIPAEAFDKIPEAVSRLVGRVVQIPPRVSAVKVGGRRLYQLTRRGIEASPPPRSRIVYRVEVRAIEPPVVRLRVACSSGTYVRSLAASLGEMLGTRAHLAELHRSRIGPYGIALDDSELAPTRDFLRHAVSLPDILSDWPIWTVGAQAARNLRAGRIPQEGPEDLPGASVEKKYRVLDLQGNLLALVERASGESTFRFLRVLAAQEPGS